MKIKLKFTKLKKKGIIVIPKEIREIANLKEGDELIIMGIKDGQRESVVIAKSEKMKKFIKRILPIFKEIKV